MARKYTDHCTNFRFSGITGKFFPGTEVEFEVGRWYKNLVGDHNYYLCIEKTKFSASFFRENDDDEIDVSTRDVITYMLDYTQEGSGLVYTEFVRSKDLLLMAVYFAMEDGKAIVQPFELFTPDMDGG